MSSSSRLGAGTSRKRLSPPRAPLPGRWCCHNNIWCRFCRLRWALGSSGFPRKPLAGLRWEELSERRSWDPGWAEFRGLLRSLPGIPAHGSAGPRRDLAVHRSLAVWRLRPPPLAPPPPPPSRKSDGEIINAFVSLRTSLTHLTPFNK